MKVVRDFWRSPSFFQQNNEPKESSSSTEDKTTAEGAKINQLEDELAKLRAQIAMIVSGCKSDEDGPLLTPFDLISKRQSIFLESTKDSKLTEPLFWFKLYKVSNNGGSN